MMTETFNIIHEATIYWKYVREIIYGVVTLFL